MREILTSGALRRSSVTLEGVTIQLREPTLAERRRYIEIGAKSGEEASFAFIFRTCIVPDEGEPPLTDEEALRLAGLSGRVTAPLVAAITELILEPEKKS